VEPAPIGVPLNFSDEEARAVAARSLTEKYKTLHPYRGGLSRFDR
jgi:hypothetical protein